MSDQLEEENDMMEQDDGFDEAAESGQNLEAQEAFASRTTMMKQVDTNEV